MHGMPAPTASHPSPALDARALSKLHWRCRRGLLENDLFIEQFFLRHEGELTTFHAEGMGALMDLADNDLVAEYADHYDRQAESMRKLLRMKAAAAGIKTGHPQ